MKHTFALHFSGEITMTGAEYLTAIGVFLQGCEMNLADPAAVTAALSLSSVAVTLTAAQVMIS